MGVGTFVFFFPVVNARKMYTTALFFFFFFYMSACLMLLLHVNSISLSLFTCTYASLFFFLFLS